MRYASFGSISHGTLRYEDLLDTFSSTLEELLDKQPKRFKRATYRALIRAARRDLRALEACPEPSATTDDSGALVGDLCDALNAFAPPYAYFGAHEGDGSDFGFWLCDMDDFDGLRVKDTSEVPWDYQGEVLHVNDHGNVTLYHTTKRGPERLREVWSLV